MMIDGVSDDNNDNKNEDENYGDDYDDDNDTGINGDDKADSNDSYDDNIINILIIQCYIDTQMEMLPARVFHFTLVP